MGSETEPVETVFFLENNSYGTKAHLSLKFLKISVLEN